MAADAHAAAANQERRPADANADTGGIVMAQLYRSHRAMGYLVAHARTNDGEELVILQTAPHRREVSPLHMVMPATPAEAEFEVRVGLAQVVEHSRFLGVDDETLKTLFNEELAKA